MILITAVVSFTSNANAQTGNAHEGMAWKKRVERIVELPPAVANYDRHLKPANPDASLLNMLIDAIKSGKVTAYTNWDNKFTEVLTPEKMRHVIANDTMLEEVEDPVTGQVKKVYRVREFRPEAIKKFRTLEDWTFYPETGHTEIQIAGISPVQDIYGDDGVFRGIQALFWVKFQDVKAILEEDARYHPKTSLVSRVWEDYFQDDTKPAERK